MGRKIARPDENRQMLQQLRSVHLTDAGNAEAFALLHGARFRYDHTRGEWLVWNGRHWVVDETNEADRAALSTAHSLLTAAVTWPERQAAKDLTQWAFKTESVFKREAMLKSARSIQRLATITAEFDRHPYLLTVGNGTIELHTGELREASPEELITRATNISFDPAAECPRWQEFLDEIFGGDAELIDFIWKAVGYSLTGSTQEQCLFILYGEGANGKTTFLEILLKLLGDHAATTPFSTFLVQGNPGGPRPDLARLHGARLVKAAESEHGSSLDETVIKEVTGGDTISARFLYRDEFEFKPQFKLWLATNYKPKIRGRDEAIWRRIRLIPFTRQFKGKHRDPQLMDKLEAELPGILTWAVNGCLAYLELGLGSPPTVETATQEYRQESDQPTRFFNDRCVLTKNAQASGQELYTNYRQWCEAEGDEPMSNNSFAGALVERGLTRKRGRTGVMYQGIEIVRRPVTLIPNKGGET